MIQKVDRDNHRFSVQPLVLKLNSPDEGVEF